jgi:hypothetical protein
MKHVTFVFVLLIVLLLAGCTGEAPPAVGTPAWLWLAAKDTHKAGDLDKTSIHLEKIIKQGNNPYVQRASVWRAVITAGLAQGHLELAQAYAKGWIANRTNKTFYLRQKFDHLKEAQRYGIGLFECYEACTKQPLDKALILEFTFPKGSGAEVADLDRIYKGMEMPEAKRAEAHEKALDRGVVRAVSAVLTTADDVPGAQKALASGRAEVPPARVLLAVGTALEDLSVVFDSKNLAEPDKAKLFHERAQDAAKRVLAMEPEAPLKAAAKRLQANAEKALKAQSKKGARR